MSNENRNVANINELADFIEKAEYDFDMQHAAASPVTCGSAGCIGGHAAVLWPEMRRPVPGKSALTFTWDDQALDAKLGMPSVDVCYPDKQHGVPGNTYSIVNREIAVKALRHLAETGEIFFDVPVSFDVLAREPAHAERLSENE